MNKLYEKSRLSFAIAWIVVYVAGLSIADNLSVILGVEKSVTAVVSVILSATVVIWLRRNNLFTEYGLCKSEISARTMGYYIPLIILASVNLWYGVAMNFGAFETILYVVSMLMVGFLEEIIFRGFLFKAMCKDSVKWAIVVSGVTFGMGHIVNLINGSGADLLSNLLQVAYAMAGGILFAIIFYKTKSLWPCIVTHGILNALSAFADQSNVTVTTEAVTAAVLCAVSLGYGAYVIKKS